MNSDAFDEFLKERLQERPTPRAGFDLAAAALARAGAHAGMPRQVGRLHWLSGITAIAASLLVVAMLAVGGNAVMGQSSGETSEAAATEASATDGAPTSGSGNATTVAMAVVILATAGGLWGSRGQVIVARTA